MATSILNKIIDDFRRGHGLDGSDAVLVLDALINETDESIVADVLTAWHKKGIEGGEIYQIARILRSRMKRVNSLHERFVDIVGTGGSKSKLFNISTAASFVVAGAGLPVAKHGNKAATSSSGSSDVLNELDVDSASTPELAEQNLNEMGICFMFAPNHHRLSPTLAKVRRGIGFPTIFNCVGPLCNPASAPHQVIGVWDVALVSKMAEALRMLGTVRSWVVHGTEGLDEISPFASTNVAEITGGIVTMFDLPPKCDGHLTGPPTECLATDPVSSSLLIRRVLGNELRGNPAETAVLANSAAALCVAGVAADLDAGMILATESVRSGRAAEKLGKISAHGRR